MHLSPTRNEIDAAKTTLAFGQDISDRRSRKSRSQAANVHQSPLSSRTVAAPLVEVNGDLRLYARVRPPLEIDFDAASNGELVEVLSCILYVIALLTPHATLHRQAVRVVAPSVVEVELNAQDIERFAVRRAYSLEDDQKAVWHDVEDLVDWTLMGRESCALSYGASKTGKTYTLIGTPNDPGLSVFALRLCFHIPLPGVLARVLHRLFQRMGEIQSEERPSSFENTVLNP